MRKIVYCMVAIALVLGLALPAATPVSAGAGKFYTASISTTAIDSGGTATFTVRITQNDAAPRSNNQIGSATITVPSAFTITSGLSVNNSDTADGWTASLVSGVIKLQTPGAAGGTKKLSYLEWVEVSFTATVADRTWGVSVVPTAATVAQGGSTTATVSVDVTPDGAITTTWTINAYSSTDWTGAVDWALEGTVPTVTVNVPTATLNATGQPSGVTVGFSPESGTPDFTSTMTITVGAAVTPGVYPITIQVLVGTTVKATCTFTLTVTGTACYKDETAWSAGTRYVEQGNWATYTRYVAGSTVTLYAGQTLDAGTVAFSAATDGKITITITLNAGWYFQNVAENVKIQDYATAPSGNPAPGQFAGKWTATVSPWSGSVPLNNFYGVHVDVKKEVPCP